MTSPASPAPPKLAVLLRAHRRPAYLAHALRAWSLLSPLIPLRVHVALDRPTPEVLEVLAPLKTDAIIRDFSHLPILSPGRDRFLDAQNAHLDWLMEFPPAEWVMVADDDFWFEPTAAAAYLPAALDNPDADAYFCQCLSIHALPDLYNAARGHTSIRLYRNLDPTARFTGDRMLSIPDALHDFSVITYRTAQLRVPLLEYNHEPADRWATYTTYRDSGKEDPYTRSHILQPVLRRFPSDFDTTYGTWTNLWTDPTSSPSSPSGT